MPCRSHSSSVRIPQLLIISLLSFSLHAQTVSTPTGQQPADKAPPPVAPTVVSTNVPASTKMKLGPGDLIEISVYGVPDLATKLRISNSGDIYLPLIDYVHIADLTVEEAQELIERRLDQGGFVRSPHVSIFVDAANSQAVTMIGEIGHPGSYPIVGEVRLFDLLSAAGGLSDRAGRNITIVPRDNPDKKFEIQLASNLAEDTEHNIVIHAGDTVIVSRAGIVYVVGDVNRPSGFAISDDSLTVLKALALAGGQTRTSSLNGTKILRQTPNGIQEIPVRLKKVLQAKAPDVALVKGDILFVPGSAAKALAYRGADAAMSMTTALAVIAVHP